MKSGNKIRACIFDLGGTVCDKYVLAPTTSFKKAFNTFGLFPTNEHIRRSMGKRKDEHIKDILQESDIQSQWLRSYKRYYTLDDVKNIYDTFLPLQLNYVSKYSEVIPRAKETFEYLHEQNILTGSTTGYTRPIINVVVDELSKQGVHFNSTVGGDEVEHGNRPSPHMLYKNCDNLNISSIQSVVKIDDTATGIQEGINAGCWTVGVSRFSNYMDINSLEEEKSLSTQTLYEKNKKSIKYLQDANAHFVIDSIADMPDIIQYINILMSKGYTPHNYNHDVPESLFDDVFTNT